MDASITPPQPASTGHFPRFGRRAKQPKPVKLEVFRPAGPKIWRHFRAIRRIVMLLLWNFSAYPILGVLYCLPGGYEKRYPMFYWRISCWMLGLELRVVGQVANRNPAYQGRPVIFACNHSSWLDIPALGTILEASFVAKGDVENWPLIGSMAKFARTVFVSRTRSGTGRERDEMGLRLDKGDNLILFPEGTSSDGTRVLPFRSTFFAVGAREKMPLFQPVSLVYDQLAGLPATRSTRPIFAWYGDMELFPHLWCLAQWHSSRCSILVHPPLDPADFNGRKDLALAAHRAVADGAAALRQSRPVRDVGTAESEENLSPSYA